MPLTIGMREMVRTVIRSREEPEGKCSNTGECAYLRPQGTQGKILLVLHVLKWLYFGCFRGDLDKILKRSWNDGSLEGLFLFGSSRFAVML